MKGPEGDGSSWKGSASPNPDVDPVMLRIMLDTLISIPEEMGRALRRTAYSPNIKERMDASCALFDHLGRLLAQAEHIPVHLGSMPMVVRKVLEEYPDLTEGDMILVNDPEFGGTHLPDITAILPIFHDKTLAAFAVNRAHTPCPIRRTESDPPKVHSEAPQDRFVDPGNQKPVVHLRLFFDTEVLQKVPVRPLGKVGGPAVQVDGNSVGFLEREGQPYPLSGREGGNLHSVHSFPQYCGRRRSCQ